MPDSGHGATITGSSGFFAAITNIAHTGLVRRALKTSHSGTSGYDTFQPADLVDPGGLQVTIWMNPNDAPPIASAAETWTLTFPVPSGSSNGATLAGSGFMTEFRFAFPTANEEGLMEATAVVKFSGTPTWVDAS